MAGISFAVERPRHRSRPANNAEFLDLHLKLFSFRLDLQQVSHANLACRLGRLLVALNAAQVTSSRRQGACLEEPGGPKPFIDAYAIHEVILFEPIVKMLGGIGDPVKNPENSQAQDSTALGCCPYVLKFDWFNACGSAPSGCVAIS